MNLNAVLIERQKRVLVIKSINFIYISFNLLAQLAQLFLNNLGIFKCTSHSIRNCWMLYRTTITNKHN